jgi:hypothetical protein
MQRGRKWEHWIWTMGHGLYQRVTWAHRDTVASVDSQEFLWAPLRLGFLGQRPWIFTSPSALKPAAVDSWHGNSKGNRFPTVGSFAIAAGFRSSAAGASNRQRDFDCLLFFFPINCTRSDAQYGLIEPGTVCNWRIGSRNRIASRAVLPPVLIDGAGGISLPIIESELVASMHESSSLSEQMVLHK